jgi:hydroxyacylglutathione hydrolase
VILTHSDYDHVVGIPYFPDYEVWAAVTWDESNEARSIRQIAKFDSEFYVNRPWEGEMERIKLNKKLRDGEAATGFHFYHAKGHTDDGLVTVWDGVAVVGDYLASVEFPFVYTSVRRYQETMQHMREVFRQHAVNLVITQHGPYADGKEEIAHRIQISEDYLGSIVDVVKMGQREGRTLDEVVALSLDSVMFAGKPISPGIQRFHDANVKLAWAELSQ